MHSKKLRAACCVLLAVLLTTGCTDAVDDPEIPQTEEQTATTTEISRQTTEEAPPILPEVPDTVEITEPIDGSELRTFGITAEVLYPMSDPKDGLILSADYTDSSIVTHLTDIFTGEKHSSEHPIDSAYEGPIYQYYVVNGCPVAVDPDNGSVTLFDRDYQEIKTEYLGFRSYACTIAEDSLFIPDNSDGHRYIIAEIGKDGTVSSKELRVNLGEDQEISQLQGKVRDGEYLCSYYDISTYNICYGILNESTGDVARLHLSQSEYAITAGGKIIIADYGTNGTTIFDPDYPDVKKVLESPPGSTLITACGNNLYYYSSTARNESGFCGVTLYRYDADSGRLTAKLDTQLPVEYVYISAAYEYGDDVLLNIMTDNYDTALALWQPEDIPPHSGYDAVSGADYETINRSLADKIREQYSVEVLYGNDGVRHFYDYAVVSETDEKLINNALTLLDGFFSRFPVGFFDEAFSRSEGYDKMIIYLTGQIIPNTFESQSISDATAFVTTEGDANLMVLNITVTYALEKNIAHEFMHIIENIVYTDLDGENFRRWEMLNPDDFSYYFRYTDDYGVTLGYDAVEYNGAMYYDGCETDINSIYFVDGYSMTYPGEDRARIFENIATTSADNLPAYFKGSGMQLKTAYLCACIRDSFECITDSTVLFWESSINPEYTLEYFRENYDPDAYFAEHAVG